MYELAHFKIEDRAEILAVIRDHAFGLLVSSGEDGLIANPVPFTLARDDEGRDVLRAHLARANPHWRQLAQKSEGTEVLVVFQGGDHYVTPAWYATKRETGKVVPTWNYVHVQVKGRAFVRDDADFVRAQIGALTDQHEAGRGEPWAVDDAPEAFLAAQLRGIVGIEIRIDALSGKFKLSQNRNAADLSGVVEGLASEQDASGPSMAALIRKRSGGELP